jgi:thiol-disulfide isomerase/thioredoxin
MGRHGAVVASVWLALAGAVLSGSPSRDGSALEGRRAPALDPGIAIGTRLSRVGDGPELLFFWAHWCQECKSESQTLASIAEKYRSRGLVIIAPTRRYGFANGGRPAAPDRELQHIVKIRDIFYPFMRHAAVPVTDANYTAFGVDAVPMHVLIDRDGVIRVVHEGVMTEAELDAAIARVLNHF